MMTIISTLLLKVFGINPNEDNLQKNIEYPENNENNENENNPDINLSSVNLLNRQNILI